MKTVVSALLLILLFAGAAWFLITKPPEPVHELLPPQIAPVAPEVVHQPPPALDDDVVSPETESEPETLPESLPALIESDPEVTQALADIAGAGPLAEYLVLDQIISRVVASIDSLTSRQVPVHINPVKPAGDELLVETEGEILVLSAQNFSRYDGYVTLLQNLDTNSVMIFYRRYEPLFQEAWEENSGAGSFSDRLLEVLDNLLATPDVPGPVYLTKPEAVYLFEDPELEAMNAGQKILVRMGSANAAVVKEKLAEVRAALNP